MKASDENCIEEIQNGSVSVGNDKIELTSRQSDPVCL